MLKSLLLAVSTLLVVAPLAHAATVTNADADVVTLVVTVDGDKRDVAVEAGQTIDICPTGCFLTLPNGDREALAGTETFEIRDGKAKFN
jgi:hypothetical protein